MTRLAWIAVVASGILTGLFVTHRIQARRAGVREMGPAAEAETPTTSDLGTAAGEGGGGVNLPAPTVAEGAGPQPLEPDPATLNEDYPIEPDTPEPYMGWQADPAHGTAVQATGGKLHPTATGGNPFAPPSPATIAPIVPMRDPAVIRPAPPAPAPGPAMYSQAWWAIVFQQLGFNPYTGATGGKTGPTATG